MRLCFFALLLIAASSLSFAHHSFNATFDSSKVIEIEGEVTRVVWRNPHVRFSVRVPGSDDVWKIETHSVSILSRMDVESGIIEVGDTVKVAGNPSRRPVNEMFARNTLLPSGEEVVLDPRGEPRWAEQSIESSGYWTGQEPGEKGDTGIFRVWSTILGDPKSFPLFAEGFVPDFDINSYPLTDAARDAVAAFDPLTDMPTLNCAPKGMPTIMEQPYPVEFVEQEGSIIIRLEEYDTVRTVHMDAGASAAGQSASLLGYSAGHWEDTSLVVTTTNSNWRHFDTVGLPLSGAAEITEWFTPSEDGSRLNYRLRVTDPATFTEPVELEKYWLAVPGISVQPYSCTK